MMPSVRDSRRAASRAAWSETACTPNGAGRRARRARTDGGVIEAGRNGMRRGDLAVFVLQNRKCTCPEELRGALQKNPDGRRGARRVHASSRPRPPASMPIIFHTSIAEEMVEEANGIRTAADAGK